MTTAVSNVSSAKGSRLGGARENLDRDCGLRGALAQATRHPGVGLDGDNAVRALVVAEVEAGARADLEHLSFEPRNEPVASLSKLTLLHAPAGEVVEPADHGRASSTRLPSSSIFPCAASSLPTHAR